MMQATVSVFVFFFQAEDGIRDKLVTGVQTCALPISTTEFAEKVSPKIFGRDIPQTLLLHSNDITADCLDEILTRFKARGYRFVTLDAVMADPAYQTKDTYITKYGPSWLVRWTVSKDLDVSFSGDPDPPKWIFDLEKNRQ